MRAKLTTLGIVLPIVLALDLATKSWALATLGDGRRVDLFGGLVPLSLAFNKGAAFGIGIGDDSRWFFIPVTLLALVLLASFFRQAADEDRIRHLALSLIVSGAIGNLFDRVRWDRGVVDFIGPIDLGFWDFPIFNVADMAISCGAVLLAFSFWFEESEEVPGVADASESDREGSEDGRAPDGVPELDLPDERWAESPEG